MCPRAWTVWAARANSGFFVQGLVDAAGGKTYISCGTVAGLETFQVDAAVAADAFDHPYAYGADLPLDGIVGAVRLMAARLWTWPRRSLVGHRRGATESPRVSESSGLSS